jgi:hypothetical protein
MKMLLILILTSLALACDPSGALVADDQPDELFSETWPDAAEADDGKMCLWFPGAPMPACIWLCCFSPGPRPCCPIDDCSDCTSVADDDLLQ